MAENNKEPESIMVFITRCKSTGEPIGTLISIDYEDRSKHMEYASLEYGKKLLGTIAEFIKDIGRE